MDKKDFQQLVREAITILPDYAKAADVTTTAHQTFKQIAIQLTKNMGLRLCGVDIMIAGDITQKPGIYWILEINSAPGLDHYAQTGLAQEKIVEDLYFKVLKSMEK